MLGKKAVIVYHEFRPGCLLNLVSHTNSQRYKDTEHEEISFNTHEKLHNMKTSVEKNMTTLKYFIFIPCHRECFTI
jgi:hypothetical protein